jgi:hypothetical protein
MRFGSGRDALKRRLAHILTTVASRLEGRAAAKGVQFAREVRLGKPLAMRPASTGAQAWEGCLQGHYRHRYEISSGIYAGEVWLCCVPLDELLRDSFNCGGLQLPAVFGSEADQKVQACTLVDATSAEPRVVPACIRAPLTAPIEDMAPPR